MKVIGIQTVKGEYQGKPYCFYNITCELPSNDARIGTCCRLFKMKEKQFNNFCSNHKFKTVDDVIGYEFVMDYYDGFKNLTDLH